MFFLNASLIWFPILYVSWIHESHFPQIRHMRLRRIAVTCPTPASVIASLTWRTPAVSLLLRCRRFIVAGVIECTETTKQNKKPTSFSKLHTKINGAFWSTHFILIKKKNWGLFYGRWTTLVFESRADSLKKKTRKFGVILARLLLGPLSKKHRKSWSTLRTHNGGWLFTDDISFPPLWRNKKRKSQTTPEAPGLER